MSIFFIFLWGKLHNVYNYEGQVMYYKDKSKQQTQGTNFPKFRFRNSMGDLLNCHCLTGKCILFSPFSKKIKGKRSPPNKLAESVSVIKNITVQGQQGQWCQGRYYSRMVRSRLFCFVFGFNLWLDISTTQRIAACQWYIFCILMVGKKLFKFYIISHKYNFHWLIGKCIKLQIHLLIFPCTNIFA